MGWQAAALNDLGFARFAAVPLDHPALVLKLKPGWGLPLAAAMAGLTLTLFLLPGHTRRRAHGLRVRHGHVIGMTATT